MGEAKRKVYISCTKKDLKKRSKILARAMMIRSFQEEYEFVSKLPQSDLVLMVGSTEEGVEQDRREANDLGILVLDVDEHFHDRNSYIMKSLLDDTLEKPNLEGRGSSLVKELLDDSLEVKNHELEQSYGRER